MQQRILIILKDENTASVLADWFRQQGFSTCTIERKQIITQGQLLISERFVRFRGENLLENTLGAIILDSGYMWPQPVLEPTEAEWIQCRQHLDEYLRTEREASSLWFSFLEILNTALPLCINPQAGFEAAVFKPLAFKNLETAGIPLPPYIVSNDYEKIAAFTGNGNRFYKLSLSGNGRGDWVDKDALLADNEGIQPVCIQAFSGREELAVWAVDGKIVYHQPLSADISALDVKTLQKTLNIPFAELHFRYNAGWVLSDFSAAPDFAQLPAAAVAGICGELLRYMEGAR